MSAERDASPRLTRDLLELAKVRITIAVTLTTATGYVLHGGRADWGLVPALIGTFLLACGAAVFNHVQERHTDAMMPRTRRRPVASGRVTTACASGYGALLLVAGGVILYLGSNPTALALGLLTFLWYNGIYTYLKRWTAFAVVPGSIIGALPPVLGWVAAGGSPLDKGALALGFFFFIWQIPHFWLLLLVFGRDYAQAGLPTLTSLFSTTQLQRLTFVWILTTAIAVFLFPVYGVVQSPVFDWLLLFASAWMIWKASVLLRSQGKLTSFRHAFLQINMYALLVMACLTADSLLR